MLKYEMLKYYVTKDMLEALRKTTTPADGHWYDVIHDDNNFKLIEEEEPVEQELHTRLEKVNARLEKMVNRMKKLNSEVE